MSPLRIFDYVYYCIAILYDRVFDYTAAREEIGIMFVSMLQWTNVLFLLHVFNLKDSILKLIGPIILLLIYLVIAGLNIIRYKKYVSFVTLAAKLDNQNRTLRTIKIILVVFYGILSFAALGL